MKKSLLALSVLAAIFTTGCEDKVATQKLLEAEKVAVELGNQLKTAQNEVEKLQTETTTLKAEREELKKQLDKASKSMPALDVEVVELFNKEEQVKHKKDPNEEEEFFREESFISSFASYPKTGIEWLDQLLLNEIYGTDSEGKKKSNLNEAAVRKQLEQEFEEMRKEAKEDKPIGLSESVDSSYVGQRSNIATFSVSFHSYMGGAHGMYSTRYLNVDMDKKSLITLNDLISKKNHEKVKELLWGQYSSQRLDTEGKYDGYIKKEDMDISEQFYFTSYGIVFVYPPYHLGSFAEGEIEVTLYWSEGNELVSPNYRRTKKDGFGLNKQEF